AEYRHHQDHAAPPAGARSFILIVIVCGVGFVIGMLVRFVVVAMLIRLMRLLGRIRITRRLTRGRKPGWFIIAMRGALLAEVIIGRRTFAVRISLTDQLGEPCKGIASSVGSEVVVCHRTCSDSGCRRLSQTRRGPDRSPA